MWLDSLPGATWAQDKKDEVSSSVKVPSDLGVRIRNVQLDQARQGQVMTQLQLQYQATQKTLDQDQHELDDLKKEAFETLKLDPTRYDVDLEKLVLNPKPAPQKK